MIGKGLNSVPSGLCWGSTATFHLHWSVILSEFKHRRVVELENAQRTAK